MEQEKEIIKWKGNFKNLAKVIVFIALGLTCICYLMYSINKNAIEKYEKLYKDYNSKSTSYYNYKKAYDEDDPKTIKAKKEYDEAYKKYNEYKEKYELNKEDYVENCRVYGLWIGISIGITAITLLFYFYISKMEIVVTNKRVYGKKAFGKRVDLPIDTISAVGTSFLMGIDIGTSAGKIKFKGISNNNEIHTEISKLLNNRQNNKQEQIQVNNTSTTEELKQYKELLDNGVITQEEFDAKKKQLLNL